MLSETKIDKYSDVLWWALKTARKGTFRKGDIVLVRYNLAALKLAETLQAKLLDRGMHPVLRLGMTPVMERQFYLKANNNQLVFHPPGEKTLYRNLNGSIYLHAPDSLTHLAVVEPRKIAKAMIAGKPFRDILDKREAQGAFGWSLCLFPTLALTIGARLSKRQYANQVIRACYLDKKDPVGEWKRIYRDAMAIKKWINSMDVKTLHIESQNTDLQIQPGSNRRWIGISGHNIPSFEIFLSPDWRGTEGVYYADQPSFRSGNYVEGVRLTFERGTVVNVEAEQGEPFLRKTLTTDKGASRVGEFSLTDKRFSRINCFMANTLYDENYGGSHGNCHVALGASYGDTYDGDPVKLTKTMKNRLGFNDSAIHWDLVNTEKKTVTAHLRTGKRVVIYEKGMFQY
jgi:aminopeptidase